MSLPIVRVDSLSQISVSSVRRSSQTSTSSEAKKLIDKIGCLIVTFVAGTTTLASLGSTIYAASVDSENTKYLIPVTVFCFVATLVSGVCTRAINMRTTRSVSPTPNVEIEMPRSPPTTVLNRSIRIGEERPERKADCMVAPAATLPPTDAQIDFSTLT